MKLITKAVIPAAGLGTRFLPLTKTMPKEMLPVAYKPVIQYVIEEAYNAGIQDILIITGKGKRSIEDYFDKYYGTIEHNQYLSEIDELIDKINIFYIRQKEFRGLGNALSYAEPFTNDKPFALMLGDTITIPSCTRELIQAYGQYKKSIIAVERIPRQKSALYGMISGIPENKKIFRIQDLVEKPSPAETPSDLAIIGSYVFTPEIYDCIRRTGPGKGDEIQLTDAMKILSTEQEIYAYLYNGRRYDIGNRTDWFKANMELCTADKEIGAEIKDFIRSYKID